jgi:hypothetical protein
VFFGQQRLFRNRLATQSTSQVLTATLFQAAVQYFQRVDPRHRNEIVPAGKLHQAFDMSLLVRTTDQAEMILEQKMALQPQELLRHLPLAIADDLSDRDLRVVVADPRGNAAEKLKGSLVSFLERFGALPWKGLHVDRIGVWQRHHEQRHLRQLAIEIDVGKSKVDLGFTRPVAQRQEHLTVLLLPGPHGILDDRLATVVLVFVPQTLENPLRCVALLAVNLPIRLQNLIDDRQKRLQLRRPRLRPPIPRRLGVSQDLFQRFPVDAVFGTSCPLADLAVGHPAANLNPFLHVCEHPCPPLPP